MIYPDDGELFKSPQKKSEHLIFFAHFYQGHKKVLKRHVELVNELGFDAYVFNLKDDFKEHYGVPYSPISKKFGMKHALADQIEEHLNLHDQYKTKIIFAFSNIAGCAAEVLARRPHLDCVAMICDSGPGGNFIQSSYRLIGEQFKIKFLPLRLAFTPIFALIWSKDHQKDVALDFQKLPQNFPVLSIRGWKDQLITPRDIDQIFEACPNLRWSKLALPEAGHVNGLKEFPNEYRSGVESFLKNLS